MSSALIIEAQEALREIGGDWPRGEKQPAYVERLSRATTLTKSAVERILYGKRKRLYADEYLTLTAKLKALQERRAKNETAYAELHQRAVDRGCAAPVDRDGEPSGSGRPASGGGGVADRAAEATAAAGRSGAPGADEEGEVR